MLRLFARVSSGSCYLGLALPSLLASTVLTVAWCVGLSILIAAALVNSSVRTVTAQSSTPRILQISDTLRGEPEPSSPKLSRDGSRALFLRGAVREPAAGQLFSAGLMEISPPVPIDLGTLGGSRSGAVAVNDNGMVVGYSFITGDAGSHAFSWTEAGGMVDLGTLGGSESYPYAVNANGMVVGFASIRGDTESHAFSWTEPGGMVDLGTLGGSESYPNAVNANGIVVGTSLITGDTEFHAFAWKEAGGMVDLGTLGGSESYPYAVNANGMVVGFASITGDAPSHAFSWTEAGGMVDLGTLGGSYSAASAVNTNGMVVGFASITGDITSALSHATLWKSAVKPEAPSISEIAPNSGPTVGGTPVTIIGTGFIDGATVTFDSAPATVLDVQPTAIMVLTPPHAAGPVDVVVTNSDGQSATLADGFNYFSAVTRLHRSANRLAPLAVPAR